MQTFINDSAYAQSYRSRGNIYIYSECTCSLESARSAVLIFCCSLLMENDSDIMKFLHISSSLILYLCAVSFDDGRVFIA